MLQNYIKIAVRNLMKNSVYSFINIFGLAIGLTCSLLITLWVIDEYSFDKFHQNRSQLYQIYINHPGDHGILTGRAVPLPLVEEFKTNERDIRFATMTNWGDNHLLTPVNREVRFMKQGLYAGEDFLRMFSFHLLKGDGETALKGPHSIVLTESTALALFGAEEPMGKIIHIDNSEDVTVTGIIRDVPSNSTLQFEILLPFEAYMTSQPWVKNSFNNWQNNSFQIYVQLAEDANKDEVESRIRDVIKKHLPENESGSEVMLHPMSYWRLYSTFENGKVSGGAIEQVRLFSLVAVFILVIACINFMNLSTARSERRAREVGIRKTIGSRRKELIIQFLGESILVTTLAFIAALCISEMVLPLYNMLVGKKLFIDYTASGFWLTGAGVVLFTGIISGSYPALYLSSFNAVSVLKGKLQLGRTAATPRKVLVTLQFFFSLFLIIGTIVFNQQVEYGKNRSLGYDKENLLMIENQGDVQKNYQVLKEELLSKNLVTSVTQSNSPITSIFSFMGNVSWEGKRDDQRSSIATIATGYDYVKTFGFKLLEGRDFSEQFNDSASLIINQSFVDYMGLENPIGEIVTWDSKKFTIVGVVDNAIMASIYQPIDPLMIVYDPSWFAYMTVRIAKSDELNNSLKEIESVFKKHNPAYPFAYRFADVEFEQKFTKINLITRVTNVFALLAIAISCLGLFGLAAYTAEQRTKEIGIRKVMGATVTGVVMLLSKDFAKLVMIAFAFAGPLAWWSLDNWLERYPYRIQMEWWMLAVAGALTLAIALVTVSSQALKAAVSNPAKSLRTE